jgi:hypothetical protein
MKVSYAKERRNYNQSAHKHVMQREMNESAHGKIKPQMAS